MLQSSKIFKFWNVYGALLAVANILYFTHNFVGWVVVLGYFLFVPGYLILSLLEHEIKEFWELTSLSLGLSLLTLMLGGLALNSMHAFGLTRPLTTLHIFTMLDTITLILLAINKDKAFSLSAGFWRTTKEQVAMILTLTLLPILAIGGAIRLNNGTSNILTLVLFALIPIVFLILVFRKRLEPLYPYAIIIMGLSILLSTSLRGWSITGHDIQREFYVFQLTNKAGYWNIGAFHNPYNACLSITILPTILAKITTISDPYIYKAVFQVIFAVGLAPIYFFIKRVSNMRTAFFGSLLFISFPTFLNDMPFINRQEIAFIFFGLLILVAFMEMAKRPKTILTILCLLGLVLSHYSSSYITLGILILSVLFFSLLRYKTDSKDTIKKIGIPLLSLPILLIALVATFLWNSQITNTAVGLQTTITQSFKDLIDHSSAESEDTSYSLFSANTKTPPELLANYAGKNLSSIQYKTQPDMPLTGLGKHLSGIVSTSTLNSILRAFFAKILQILVLIGVVIQFYRYRKKPNTGDSYILALSTSCLVLLVLQTLLPQLSVDYGTLRFFQQALVVLAIPIILALESMISKFNKAKAYIIPIFLVIMFLDLSGFVPQILGNYPAQLSLDNSGSYYDLYYVHKGELTASNWVVSSFSKPVVTMDQYSQIRFLPYITQHAVVINSLITTNKGLFYQDYTNIHTGLYSTNISGDTIEYSDSYDLNTANHLYSNQDSDVYFNQ